MGDDFKMAVQKNNEGLALELTGRFDKDSAKEVISFIKNKKPEVSRFYIDTQGLLHDNPAELIIDEWSQWDASLLAETN
ncbi:MAG: hypothetical protein EHM45_15050 [Desulfobacteraceae bacterium]|nr:MAG: hypothetical protein EHM45_15050 [Desulfobacteraceae bacterium]